MWPFILIGILIFLLLIVISVCAYPMMCAWIVIACKRYNVVVTCIFLLFTIGLYLFACTNLERFFDNWCYSVYAGVVLTPIVLYVCTGLKEPSKWPESGEKPRHNKIIIPFLTLFSSLLFTIEGGLRMAHSKSAYFLLNYGWSYSKTDGYWFYYDEFQYAGGLLFFVSIISTLYIGFSFVSYYKAEMEKNAQIEGEINKITQQLNKDSSFLLSLGSKQMARVILFYNAFCQKIIAVLESSDEKNDFSYEFSPFNNMNTSYKVLLLSNSNRSFYFYPMGVVVKNSGNSIYQYIPWGRTAVSMKTEQTTKKSFLPNDVRPIRQFWMHSCRDGSPDLRYKYNPVTLVYKYGILSIGSLIIHVFRLNAAKDVVSAYNSMYSCIAQMKVQQHLKIYKHHDEKTTSPQVKNSTSDNITENKEIIPKNTQFEDDQKSKQSVIVETPKTLEECFSDIILKSGSGILVDKNFVNLISASYKEIDIKEYKDVLDSMVSDNFLYQFIDPDKQNDFALYNLTSSFARQNKVNVQKSLFIAQALVSAIKKVNQ